MHMLSPSKDGRGAVTGRPTALVFFDFDNTIIHGDAGPAFGAYVFRQRLGTRKGLWGRAGLYLRYTPFATSMGVQSGLYKLGARRRSSIVRSAYRGLRGAPADEFYQLMDAFVDEEVPGMVYPEMVDVLRQHQEMGRRCVIVTTGMEPLVRRALKHIAPAVDLIGCRLEERDGRLTGRVKGPLFGVDKANIMDAYARPLGIGLRDCWAYSDHVSDLAMLEAVGHPVVVGARGRLRRIAQRRGWPVLDPKPPAGHYPGTRRAASARAAKGP